MTAEKHRTSFSFGSDSDISGVYQGPLGGASPAYFNGLEDAVTEWAFVTVGKKVAGAGANYPTPEVDDTEIALWILMNSTRKCPLDGYDTMSDFVRTAINVTNVIESHAITDDEPTDGAA